MPDTIAFSVGEGGVNKPDDVRTVQRLLNLVRASWGGPAVKLGEDGKAGPKTKQAIRDFQVFHFRQVFLPDARVDVKELTWKRLVDAARCTLTPAPERSFKLKDVPLIIQPVDQFCWAAAAAMLASVRDHKNWKIEDLLKKADAKSGTTKYMDKYHNNEGLSDYEMADFLTSAGIKWKPRKSYSLNEWVAMTKFDGPLGVVGVYGLFPHIRVVFGIRTDGTPFGTFVTMHDPKGWTMEDHFLNFISDIENISGNKYREDLQIWFC